MKSWKQSFSEARKVINRTKGASVFLSGIIWTGLALVIVALVRSCT